MRITDVRAHHIRIPYDAGVASFRQGASAIAALDMVIVEVSTDTGLTGWGDAFAYVCPKTTLAAIDEMIAPQARGLEVPDAAGIPAFMDRIQRNLHLFGRYGITMFAISGLDIALWDLAARAQGRAAASAARRPQAIANSGLCEPAPDRDTGTGCERMRGRAATGLSRDQAARDDDAGRIRSAAGDRRWHSADGRHELPAGWGRRDRVRASLPRGGADVPRGAGLAARGFCDLGGGARQGRARIAAGENACTAHQFRQMMIAGAVSYAQPSVIKVGGITEYLKVAALADEMGVRLAPHSPYFGPGLLATLQLMSLRDDGSFVEIFYMNRAACLWRGRIDADANGTIAVPEGPGLGYEPDREIMERYRV